ncbi:MAG: VOC family protein [Actinobacteria bacterium]|nr:VOC family protein [Actinomycetota bacterium]
MRNAAPPFSSFAVNDIEAARSFYGETLGMQVSLMSMGILEMKMDSETPVIVYPKPDHEPATYTVLNFPVDDIEQTVDELTAKGVQFEHYDGEIKTDAKGIARGGGGPEIAWFKDPAGNILSVLTESAT